MPYVFIRVTLERMEMDSLQGMGVLIVPEYDTHTSNTLSRCPDTPSIVGRHSNPAWPSAHLLLVPIYDQYRNANEGAGLI